MGDNINSRSSRYQWWIGIGGSGSGTTQKP